MLLSDFSLLMLYRRRVEKPMTTGQLLLTILGLLIVVFGASWLNTHQIDKRLEEMNKRIEAQFKALRSEMKSSNNRLESDFKRDLNLT